MQKVSNKFRRLGEQEIEELRQCTLFEYVAAVNNIREGTSHQATYEEVSRGYATGLRVSPSLIQSGIQIILKL